MSRPRNDFRHRAARWVKTLTERQEALRHVLFLKTLPEEVIAAAGDERLLRKGEMLFAESDRCLGLIVILTGAIKVYKLDNRGRELTLGS